MFEWLSSILGRPLQRGLAVRWVAVASFLAVVFSAAPATAEIPIATWGEDDDSGIELSGYAWTLSGVQHLDYETPPTVADTTGLNTEVVRFEWAATFGDTADLNVANEFLWRLDSGGGGGGLGTQLGLEATRQPDRLLDLQSTLVDESGLSLTHDVDRASATFYTSVADVTVGRQGITWGRTLLFPVADLWSRFSPFEINTQDKPGIDAVRALFYPSMTSEVDVVVADRGSLEDLSGAVRGGFSAGPTDVFVAGGKFWNELLLTSGVTWVLNRVKLRAEAALPWNLDDEELKLPRATGGVEYYTGDFTLGAEYHFNGAGAQAPDGYASTARSGVFQRGETYFLGRHYVGALGTYRGLDSLIFELVGITNARDPSAILAPSISYEIAQNTTAALGAYATFGEAPKLTALPPTLESEFGSFGHFYYARIGAYF